jgi:hypothetical protein
MSNYHLAYRAQDYQNSRYRVTWFPPSNQYTHNAITMTG